jgi:hypothetical protein
VSDDLFKIIRSVVINYFLRDRKSRELFLEVCWLFPATNAGCFDANPKISRALPVPVTVLEILTENSLHSIVKNQVPDVAKC